MKKLGFLLIGILVTGGFGVLGYLVGENFQNSTKDNDSLMTKTVLEKGTKVVVVSSGTYDIQIKN